MEVIREGMDSVWLIAISQTFRLTRPALASITNL